MPALLVCGNLKTGVTRPDRYEPDINADYADLAAHNGCADLAARVRKPRDKAKVEVGVLHAYRMVLAPLRNRTFFSVSELNDAISAFLEVLNDRPFKIKMLKRTSFGSTNMNIYIEKMMLALIPFDAISGLSLLR